MSPTHTILFLALMAGLALTPGAAAQNALDRDSRNDATYKPIRRENQTASGTSRTLPSQGNALDANSRAGSGGVNDPGIDWKRDIALRNAIVTGNIGSNKAFRGDVGYSAAEDFRGRTATDESFSRERSASSAAAVAGGLRGLGGLRTALDTGSRVSFSDDVRVRRPGSAATAADITARPGELSNLSVDPFSGIRGVLRSTADSITSASNRPHVLAGLSHAETSERRVLLSSPLQSVRELSLNNPAVSWQEFFLDRGQRESSRDSAQAVPSGQSEPIGKRLEAKNPFQQLQDQLREQSQKYLSAPLIGASTKPESSESTPLEDRESPSIDRFDEMMESLRQDLIERLEIKESKNDLASDAAGENTTDRQQPVLERARALVDFADARVESLLGGDEERSFYAFHMERGSQYLREGRYFDAEERFSSAALAQDPAPLAEVGRLHAQIGAGLYRSAAANLRSLLSRFPELIPARFDESLLPAADRLNRIRDQLRIVVEERYAFSRDAALLQAYIGYQLGQRSDIRHAFAALEEVGTKEGHLLDEFEQIVREVWLDAEAK